MKILLILIVLFLASSCQVSKDYDEKIIIQNNNVYFQNLNDLTQVENALIQMYLYAYGNACNPKNNSAKCKILKHLQIEDECDQKNILFLNNWFSNNVLLLQKLKKCPAIKSDSPIQNKFEYLKLSKQKDTVTIFFNVKGLNNSQEKSWNYHGNDKFLIKRKSLIKI